MNKCKDVAPSQVYHEGVMVISKPVCVVHEDENGSDIQARWKSYRIATMWWSTGHSSTMEELQDSYHVVVYRTFKHVEELHDSYHGVVRDREYQRISVGTS